MRYLLAAAALPLAALGAVAQAEPIPPDLLAGDRRSCVAACTSQGVAVARCKPYCDCTFKRVGAEFTLEEYQAGLAAQRQDQAPPQALVERMAAISKACAAQAQ
ncbi:hypothetical protein [Dongia sp.]|uniref:hypothetical protein n=1 Tax=Dongia sp. TaxID=1977262 RepID=UPI00374FFE09